MEAAYLQTRMLFHPAQVPSRYGFLWRSILAPLFAVSWWIRWSAIVLTLALCVAIALQKVAAITKMSHTTLASVASVKRIAKQAKAEYTIVDTEKGLDGSEASRASSQPIVDDRAPAGIHHTNWRQLFTAPLSGKNE
jgi:cytoskeletal protein RodZ